MNPKTRTWILIVLLMGGLLAMSYIFGERKGFFVGAFACIFILMFSFVDVDLWIQRLLRGQRFSGPDSLQLENIVQELAAAARIPMPRIYIVDLDLPTALSSGRKLKSSKIYLSKGLIENLSPEEIKGVIAYQIATILRQETFSFSVGSGLSNSLNRITSWLDGIFSNKKRKYSSHLAEELFAPLTALPVKLFVRRSSYYAIDTEAARLVGQPRLIARVLWKLHSFAGAHPIHLPPSTAPLFIVNPLTSKKFYKYFQRQPSIESRIENLVGHFPA